MLTYKELNYIQERGHLHTNKELAAALNKSVSTIKRWRRKLRAGKIEGAADLKIPRKNPHNITWELVREIRRLWKEDNFTLDQLREKFGFDVYSIVNGTSWQDAEYKRPRKRKGRR